MSKMESVSQKITRHFQEFEKERGLDKRSTPGDTERLLLSRDAFHAGYMACIADVSMKKIQEDRLMSDELKPCPFCGGKAALEQLLENKDDYMASCDNDECLVTCVMTHCDSTRKEAIEAWNRRAEQSPLQWTKTPPTEKDLGKVFVAKRRRNDGTEELFTGRLQISKSFDRILRLNASSHCGVQRTERVEFLVIDGYEFLGPLPE